MASLPSQCSSEHYTISFPEVQDHAQNPPGIDLTGFAETGDKRDMKSRAEQSKGI